MTDLTPEEQQVVKELARNLVATTRIGRLIKTVIIWFASVIGGGYVVWEFFLKSRGHG